MSEVEKPEFVTERGSDPNLPTQPNEVKLTPPPNTADSESTASE